MSDQSTTTETESDDSTERAVRERIDRLVTAANDRIDSTDGTDPEEKDLDVEPVAEAFGDLADEAADLLTSTDSRTLLSAVELLDEAGEEADEAPASIPAAIARGDPDRVATLRTILALSSLPGQEAVDEEGSSTDDGDEAEFDETELRRSLTRLRESVSARSAAESEAADAGATGGDADDDGDESDDGAGEAVRSALEGALSETRDELETLSDALGTDDSADDGTGASGEEVAAGGDESGDEDAAETDESGAGPLERLDVDESVLDEFDVDPGALADLDVGVDREGLETMADADLTPSDLLDADLDLDSLSDLADLGTDRLEELGGDLGDTIEEATGSGGVGSGGRATMLSTMPNSDRADMRAVRRYSTMPKSR